MLNRLTQVDLPPGVEPQIAPTSPTGEIYRYMLKNPKDAQGKEIYTLYDLKALNDWKLEKEFRRVPRIADVVSFGGAVKRYEIHPDPDRLKQYGITLEQLENGRRARATPTSAAITCGRATRCRRCAGLGLIGGGQDPTQQLMPACDPKAAGCFLRAEENRRLREIRQIVLTATNNVPIKVGDVVEGGRHGATNAADRRGVIVGHHTRAAASPPVSPKLDENGEEVLDQRQTACGKTTRTSCRASCCCAKARSRCRRWPTSQAKVEQLNQPGELLPGVKLDTIYDRTNLINLTTTTVRENVLVGIGLVVFILLVFLNHTRSALIVAHQYSAGAVVRLRDALLAGQIGQPAVARRGRLRHHRRLVGDHGRGDLSPAQLGRGRRPAAGSSASCAPPAKSSGACSSRR